MILKTINNTTSIEWIYDELVLFMTGNSDFESAQDIFKYGNQIHKEEMHNCASFWRGKENEIEKPIFDEWYNKTFKSKQ